MPGNKLVTVGVALQGLDQWCNSGSAASVLLHLLSVASCLVLLVALEQVVVLDCSELLQLLLVLSEALVAVPVCSALPLLLQVVVVSVLDLAVLFLLQLPQPQPSPGYQEYSVSLLRLLQPLVHCSGQRLPQLPLHRCSPLLQGAPSLVASVELVVVSADLLLLLLPQPQPSTCKYGTWRGRTCTRCRTLCISPTAACTRCFGSRSSH